MPRAFLVASSCDALSGGLRRTGASLHQLGQAHQLLTRAGWEVALTSPAGGTVPLCAGSLSEEWAWASRLAHGSVPIHELHPGDADAWFVLGGHGALCDLVQHTPTQVLIAAALRSDRPVAAVDHGSAVLAALSAGEETALLAGRAVTGRSDVEERQVRHHTLVPSTTEQLLRRSGAHYSSHAAWQAFVVVDRNLVTGQNPASTAAAVSAVVEGLSGAAHAA
jgi:putative intracellular protease/amidase